MIGGACILLCWSAVEMALARGVGRVGFDHAAGLHRAFGRAMAAIGAVLLLLTWIAR